MTHYLNESKIERIVERETDKLDNLFLNGALSKERYEEKIYLLDKWADKQYEALASYKLQAKDETVLENLDGVISDLYERFVNSERKVA